MNGCLTQSWSRRVAVFVSLVFLLLTPVSLRAQTSRPVPDHVPPKRSSQIHDGFGINSTCRVIPISLGTAGGGRACLMPASTGPGSASTRTDRTSRAGTGSSRSAAYSPVTRNSMITSIRLSTTEMKIQVQLHLRQPHVHVSQPGNARTRFPEPGSFHNDDRSLYSVFWPPKTPDQIAAFIVTTAWW